MIRKFSKEEIFELKEWASENIISILCHLGIPFTDNGRHITAPCLVPYHPGDGDNNKAWVWSCSTNNWRCYSHACQEDTSSDIIGLVMAMKEIAFPLAVNYLNELKNGEIENFNIIPYKNSHNKKVYDNIEIDEKKLNLLMPDFYFKNRGISENILKLHKVGYWQKNGTFMNKRAIVPIFNINNKLVGFSGRTVLEDECNVSKWVHGKDFVTMKNGFFSKSSILYNLNNCKNLLLQKKSVYITEGPIDLWKIQMAGIENVVATLGLGLSFEQQELLISLGVENVILCYDNDEKSDGANAGLSAANRVKDQIGHIFNVVIKLPTRKDFGDMELNDIRKVLCE